MQALAKRFEGLEPLAKARALLAGTFMRPEALAACRQELRSLAEQVQKRPHLCGTSSHAMRAKTDLLQGLQV